MVNKDRGIKDDMRLGLQEALGKHFLPHVYHAVAELGVSTINDAYYMDIDDFLSLPKLTRVQAHKLHNFSQYHSAHQQFPDRIAPVTYWRGANQVSLRQKSAKDLPAFSGKLCDWFRWKEEATTILGYNSWLRVSNHKGLSYDPEFVAINTSLYWAITQAVQFGESQHCVKVHQTTASGIHNGNGNGAWHSLVTWFETNEWQELMAASLEKAIDGIIYKELGDQTVGGFIDELNGLLYEHTKYCGADTYPESRKLRIFKQALSKTVTYANIMDFSLTQKWDFPTLQSHLCLKEVMLTSYDPRAVLGVTQRRMAKVPEDLMLPLEVYRAVRYDNPQYREFHSLIEAGQLGDVKKLRTELIGAFN